MVVYPDGECFLDAADRRSSDCILMDVRLPGRDGLAILGEMRRQGDATPVIVLTGHGDVPMAVRALREGAQDFIEKPFDDEDLVRRIGIALDERETSAAEAAAHAAILAKLTPREREVMCEVVAGHANKVIAHRLGMSAKTVEIHRSRVMEKTGAKSLPHLVRFALKVGVGPETGFRLPS